MKRIIPTVLIIAVMAACFAGCASPEDVEKNAQSSSQQGIVINQPIREEPHLLTAEGVCEKTLAPEYAAFSCTVSAAADTAADTDAACRAAAESIRAAFGDDATLGAFSPAPAAVYETIDGTQTVIGYASIADIEVVFMDYLSIDAYLAQAVSAGAGGALELQFCCPALGDEYLGAVAIAVGNARASAEAMAASAGVALSDTPYFLTETSVRPSTDEITFAINALEQGPIEIPVFPVRAAVEVSYQMP